MSAEVKICGLPGGGRWVLVPFGAGSFLNPPGDAEHDWSVAEYRGSRSTEAESSVSLRGALDSEWVPSAVKSAARRKLAASSPECTEAWLRSVYGYFRNCYSPDGADRRVDRCMIVSPNRDGYGYVLGPFGRDGWREDLPPAETHLAVLFVRQFFPDHEPRTDLIADPNQVETS